MGSRHLISTPASVGHCPRCRAQTFSGWSEGLLVHAEPVAIALGAERAVRALGRETYVLTRGELVYRDSEDVGGVCEGVLLSVHICGQVVDVSFRARCAQ